MQKAGTNHKDEHHQKQGVRSLGALLVDPNHIPADELESMFQATSNADVEILSGLSGLGAALASASSGSGGINKDHVAYCGWLVQTLADTLTQVRWVREGIEERLNSPNCKLAA